MEKKSKEYINPIARVVIENNGYILLSNATSYDKRFDSKYHFLPGGHVEYMEDSLTTINREIKEEITEYDNITIIGFLGILECVWNNNGKPYHEINIVFRGTYKNFDLKIPPKSNEKHIEFNWYKIDDLKNLNILPQSFVDLIPNWIKKSPCTLDNIKYENTVEN